MTAVAMCRLDSMDRRKSLDVYTTLRPGESSQQTALSRHPFTVAATLSQMTILLSTNIPELEAIPNTQGSSKLSGL